MGSKVVFLAVLLLTTVVLLIVYESLLVTSGNTLRVAVSFPFPFQHQHTSIQVDIANEVEGNVEPKVHAVPVVNVGVNESATGNIDGMLQVRNEHLEEQQVASAKVPSISPPTLYDSTTYENSNTSSEHTLPPTVTRSLSPHLTTVSKGEYLTSTNQLPPTMQSGQPVISVVANSIKLSPQTVLLQQNSTSVHPGMTQAHVGMDSTTNHPVASTTSSHRDLPQTSSQRCKQQYCVEHLLSHEKLVYFRCSRRVPQGMDMGCRCQFVDAVGRRVVALVSLPGSGNTWVRGLLEKATGVCTGSIYCDKTLRAEGFCGEGLRSGAVLVVKTHDSILQWKGERAHDIGVKKDRPFFDAAIFLIRSPFRAAVAEWNREVSSRFSRNQNGSNHVKYVDKPQFFGQNAVWNRIVRYQAVKWQLMVNSNVLRQGSHPILTVRYEDLKRNPTAEVRRMLDFLQFPYSITDVEQKLHEGFTQFYRNHTDSFEHFTNEQKEFVNGIILGTVQKLQHSKNVALGRKLQEYVLR